jgi:hypothetical protein
MTPRNYIQDVNKFNLAGPPKTFQRALWEFDPSLVVVPSRQGFYYRLAQRRKLQLSDRIVQEAMWNESDTQMLASYSLVPVTTILSTVKWSDPMLFEELRRRAPWRMGGAAAVTKMIEGSEQKAKLDIAKETDERNTELAKDGWGMYRKKIGLGKTLFLPH